MSASRKRGNGTGRRSGAAGSAGRGIAILGAGNLGAAIARGIVRAGFRKAEEVHLTHLDPKALADLARAGHPVGGDNAKAVAAARIVIVSVQPQQVAGVLRGIAKKLDPARHVLVSTATGVTVEAIRQEVGGRIPVLRAMPNLGIQTGNSMTCLALDEASEAAYAEVEALFGALGETARVRETQMYAATALCASGIAFFLRAIRAAAQGGTEIGFHGEEAVRMAAQTAKGAAELLLAKGTHPETEIDQVTTPNGCTIVGLNEMEERGFSAALTGGVVAAAERAAELQGVSEKGRGRRG